MMRRAPTTPEGRLIRDRRQLLSPEPTMEEIAAKLGWSKEKFGDIERGHGRSRNGNTPREIHPTAADLARIAAELGITPQELEEAGRPDAAELLPGLGGGSSEFGPDVLALFDKLFDVLTEGRRDYEVLHFLYRSLDGEGRLKPLPARVQNVMDWIRRDSARDREAEGMSSVRIRSDDRAAS